MRLFRLPLLLLVAVGLVAAGCSDDGELGGPTIGGSLAASVGDFDYTHDDLEDEVEQWAINPAFMTQVLQIADIGAPGRRNADFVAFVLSHRTLSEQARQLANAVGYAPSEDEQNALLDQIDNAFLDPGTGGSLFEVYSDDFRRRLAADFAYQQNLGTIDPEAANVPAVSINPRYGSFEDQDRGIGRVNPPDGPLQPALIFGQ